MADTKHPAEVLADHLEADPSEQELADAAEMLRTIQALEAERAALVEKLDQSVHGHNQIFELCKQIEAERDQLRAEVEALRADAERYRWLTTCMGPHTVLCFDGADCRGKAEFDAAIDSSCAVRKDAS